MNEFTQSKKPPVLYCVDVVFRIMYDVLFFYIPLDLQWFFP